ncbi:hypothetical protein [Microbacterium sp. JZ31]|uniref:hypothetical protein n=1 Tax=Microbacterium sp. JZ31 TaxID=1906274 RepID=UPI00193194CC|nr:hypothetical protein [Microbacterium sp. JZ31]
MSAGGKDPLVALLWLAAFVAGLAVIVGIVMWRGRRKGSRTIALDAALTVAGAWLFLAVVVAGAQLIQTLTSVELTLTDAPVIWTAAEPLTCTHPDDLPDAPTVTCASTSGADVTIANLSMGARLLLASAQLLTAVLGALPAALLATIAAAALRGAAFSRSVVRALYIGAGVVLVAGIGAGVLQALAVSAALGEALPAHGIEPSFFRVTIEPLIFVSALALGALGSVFQHGTALQRDTEGLV